MVDIEKICGSCGFSIYGSKMMHTPMSMPTMIESRLLRDLIMETKLLIPGIVSLERKRLDDGLLVVA